MLGWVDCASQDDGTNRSRPGSGGARVTRQLKMAWVSLGPRHRTGARELEELDADAVAVAVVPQAAATPRWMTTGPMKTGLPSNRGAQDSPVPAG